MIPPSKSHPVSALWEPPAGTGRRGTDPARGLPRGGKGSVQCDQVMTTGGKAGDQRLSAWEDLRRASEKR